MKIYRLGLEQMQKELVKLLENAHDGFFALDKKWRYLYVNPTVEKYERVSKKKILGKVIWEEFPNAKKTLFYKKYHEAMATGKNLEFEEHLDGRWFDIHVTPFGKGKARGIWVSYRDTTAHKLADERKDEFIRMTSHELKTPITSLKLYAELLREMITDPEASEYIYNINHQADQLNRLVTDMLDLSRIELGKMELKKKKLDLIPLVQEIAGGLQKTILHQIEIVAKVDQAIVLADKLKLAQAITNLINNAAKYSPGRDRITITIQKNKIDWEISVQDFGIGIDPAYHDQIFDRFFQGGGTKGKVFPGLGIGLYITKMIAEKHRGKINFESAVGQGSTFTLSLPSSV